MVYELWRNTPGISMAKAARQFLERCPEELIAYIKPENREARLQTGALKLRKLDQTPPASGH